MNMVCGQRCSEAIKRYDRGQICCGDRTDVGIDRKRVMFDAAPASAAVGEDEAGLAVVVLLRDDAVETDGT